MLIQLTPLQARVIGVLMEKEITTPDQYPLSLNALTLGCNQKSSREPIMQLSESDVQNILDELAEKKLLFEHQSGGSRVIKYKHRFCNTEFSNLKFSPQQFGIICVLLLRGPQTPGELRTRTNRLADFANVNEVEVCLMELSDFNAETLVVKLPRELGKREARYTHLFCGDDSLQGSQASAAPDIQQSDSSMKPALALEQALARIEVLEKQVSDLNKRVDDMQENIDILSA